MSILFNNILLSYYYFLIFIKKFIKKTELVLLLNKWFSNLIIEILLININLWQNSLLLFVFIKNNKISIIFRLNLNITKKFKKNKKNSFNHKYYFYLNIFYITYSLKNDFFIIDNYSSFNDLFLFIYLYINKLFKPYN